MYEPRRQHPSMILMETMRRTTSILGTVLLLTVLLGAGSLLDMVRTFLYLLALLTVISLLYHAVKWYACVYRFEEDNLHLETGILFKKERFIKRERVQSVNTSTDILQRLFGVATLEVKTAGSGPESGLTLIALTRGEIERIRSLLGAVTPRYHAEEHEEVVYRVPTRDLFLAGITSGRFMILFTFLAVAFSQVYGYIPEHYIEYLLETVVSAGHLLIIMAFLSLFMLSWFISILAYMVRYAKFTIRRQGDRLNLSWGLIEQRQVTLKLHRIQALSVKEELLRQPFGLCSLNVEVAGEWSGDRQEVKLLHPIIRKRDLGKFMERVLPEYRIPDSMIPLPRQSLRRYIIRAFVPTLIVVIVLQLAPYGMVSVLLLPPALLLGLSRYRTGRTAIDAGQITFRFRNMNRYHVMIRRGHMQSLGVTTNPFQRIGRLRTVRAAVMSSMTGRVFTVKDVEADEARRIWNWYSSRS